MKPWNCVAVLLVLLLASLTTAQVATGTPAFGSFGGGPFDTVNLGNLNVYFAIPVLHKAGRGMPFTYDLVYNSSVWSAASVNGVMTWVPDSNFGWISQTAASVGYVTYVQHKGAKCPEGGFIWTYDTYVYHDMFGASHTFDASGSIDCLGNASGDTSVASDGSGYTINIVYPPRR